MTILVRFFCPICTLRRHDVGPLDRIMRIVRGVPSPKRMKKRACSPRTFLLCRHCAVAIKKAYPMLPDPSDYSYHHDQVQDIIYMMRIVCLH
mmetsp:Transcript_32376/g.78976  ORF Transcript_32376/g.78976 Transcript_32376/m.78976 type:complete len:92 (-) Transcript_32376:252-527(-)